MNAIKLNFSITGIVYVSDYSRIFCDNQQGKEEDAKQQGLLHEDNISRKLSRIAQLLLCENK